MSGDRLEAKDNMHHPKLAILMKEDLGSQSKSKFTKLCLLAVAFLFEEKTMDIEVGKRIKIIIIAKWGNNKRQ